MILWPGLAWAQSGALLPSPLEVPTAASSTVSSLLVPGGLLAGVVNLLLAMLPDFYLSLIRIWITIASFLGLRKKPPAWGVVYDSVTKRPLDPVYVSLYDAAGREIASTITSLDGRYGFLVPPGNYQIKAEKTHYRFPSRRLFGLDSDILYSGLYFGGPLTVTREGLVAHNIPLDPLAFDWNQFAKKDRKLLRFYARLSALQTRLVSWFFSVGFFASVVLLFLSYNPLNIAIALLYIGVGIIHSITQRSRISGVVLERGTKLPLPFAIVRVYSADGATEIAHTVSDRYGRYYALVPPGNYQVRIERKNNDGSYSPAGQLNVRAPHGIVREKLKI